MWYEIFKFEINYRLTRWDTYLFFVFLFIFSLFGVEFIFQGIDLGLVKKNSPIVIAKAMGVITGFSMLFMSMVMGVPVLRDFQYNIASLIYVNPISKADYLLGRFLGSIAILLCIFSGLLWGMMLSEFMPWVNAEEYQSFQFINYLQPFLWVATPIAFFGASLFFVTGALTKKLLVVYTQGLFVFVLFLLTKAITNEQLQSLLDPFSLTTLTLSTKSWSIADRNTILIPFSGDTLYNKLFWIALAIVTLVIGYIRFQLNTVPKTRAKSKPNETTIIPQQEKIEALPSVHPLYGLKAQFMQLVFSTWFHAKLILKEISFWAIILCSFIIIVINSVSLDTLYGVDSYPTTYLIIEELQEMSIYFFAIILIFYSAELIWKEKEVKIGLIADATAVTNLINLSSKFLGLIIIYSIVILALIIGGMAFQTASGYYLYEFKVYFNGFFLEILPFLVLYTFASFFLHIVTGKKFVGILMTIVFFIINVAIGIFGINHVLVNFGGNGLASYSAMNGYGHFLQPYILVKIYWMAFGVLLLLFASILMSRGTETSLLQKLKSLQKNRISKSVLLFSSFSFVVFIGVGGYIFYNTNILNQYFTKYEKQAFRVAYEKNLKKFEYLPQPKIVDANLKFDLYPSTRSYKTKGYYILKNTGDESIHKIHVQNHPDNQLKLSQVQFNRETTTDTQFQEFGHSIFTLNEPLQSGDSVKMEFTQTYTPVGFEMNDNDIEVLNNGTFFKNDMLPTLGYNRKYELQDEYDRKDFQLPSRENKANRNNPLEIVNARTGSDSDGLTLEMIIGTDISQTAITSGDLIEKWTKNNRNYFHYKNTQPIINFYPIVSAKYQSIEETHIPVGNPLNHKVDLEIYYHKGHEYNLESMMRGMKASLDYYSTHFSPYQYNQLRIMEFPRYRKFAQSLPNTIPFSESLGFILNIKEDDVDLAFYITAHEVAHQWWGMQLEAANVKGRNMILETLSQYSAVMVLKENYDEEEVKKFLEIQLEDYLEGKRRMQREEVPLVLVENEEHLYYAKGAINMYALQKEIGEEKVNLALKKFLNDWHTFNNPTKPNRYATTEDLIKYFRQETPDSLQHIISDLFEEINLVDEEYVDELFKKILAN